MVGIIFILLPGQIQKAEQNDMYKWLQGYCDFVCAMHLWKEDNFLFRHQHGLLSF